MTYVKNGLNDYGTEVSHHRCDTCGRDYTVTPAVPPEKRDEWDHCLSEDCDSYEPMRDAELYFGLGMVARDDD